MPFSSGTFSVVYNWTTESGAPPIEIAKLDTQHADFATGLSNCILRDGSGLPTAAIPWNSQNLTGVAQLEAARFVPTGSTVPSNGMYLPAANTVAFASNTTLRGSVNATGNWTFAAPSSGTALTVNGVAATSCQRWTDGTVNIETQFQTNNGYFGTQSNHPLTLFTNNTNRVAIAATGNVTINAPSSGTALTVTGVSAGTVLSLGDGTRNFLVTFASSRVDIGPQTGDILSLLTNNSRRVEVAATGNVTINAPSSGPALTVSGGTGGQALFNGTASGGNSAILSLTDGQSGTRQWLVSSGIPSAGDFSIRDNTASTNRVVINSTGNVTINAPSSGVALTTSGSLNEIRATDGTTSWFAVTTSSVAYTGTRSNHPLNIRTNDTDRLVVSATGNVTINAPSSGTALTVTGVAGGAGAIINGSVHTPPVAVTFSATAMTVNCTLSNVFTTTFTANVTTAPTLSNPQDGQTINWFITQDATGGRTMTWPSTFRWPGGVAGVLSTAANAVDLMVATYRSGPNAWYASLSKGFA